MCCLRFLIVNRVIIIDSSSISGSDGIVGLIFYNIIFGSNRINPIFAKAEYIVDFLKVCCCMSKIAAKNSSLVILLQPLYVSDSINRGTSTRERRRQACTIGSLITRIQS